MERRGRAREERVGGEERDDKGEEGICGEWNSVGVCVCVNERESDSVKIEY